MFLQNTNFAGLFMHYEMAYFVNPLQNYGYFLICANVLREKVRFL